MLVLLLLLLLLMPQRKACLHGRPCCYLSRGCGTDRTAQIWWRLGQGGQQYAFWSGASRACHLQQRRCMSGLVMGRCVAPALAAFWCTVCAALEEFEYWSQMTLKDFKQHQQA